MTGSLSTIIGFPSKFGRAVRRHGVVGVVKVAADQAIGVLSRLRPSIRREILRGEQRAHEFDEQFGVDTAGYIHPTELKLNHPNQVHAVSYGASDPRDFRNAITSLPIDCTDFVFVDFGSGKGRVILLASEFPFKRVVGVELSEELHGIAQDNIKHFSKNGSRRANVESICMDAVDYPLPEDNLVCYFCNPFDATLMTRMVSKIQESLLRKPREIFILYYNAKEGHVFDQADCFQRVESTGWIRIWRTVLESRQARDAVLC
jgi:SAM-dependent methyltransferase